MFQIFKIEFDVEGSFGTPLDDVGGYMFDNESAAEEVCDRMNSENFYPNDFFYSVREA